MAAFLIKYLEDQLVAVIGEYYTHDVLGAGIMNERGNGELPEVLLNGQFTAMNGLQIVDF